MAKLEEQKLLLDDTDTLIQAVRAGELDDLFTQASKARPVPKPRRAACFGLTGEQDLSRSPRL